MSRKIVARTLATNKPDTFIKIEVSYVEGGLSYFNYTQVPRGFDLTVRVIDIISGMMERFTMGNAISIHLEDAKRFNQKRLGQLATECLKNEKLPEMVNQMLAKNQLELAEGEVLSFLLDA